MRAFLTFLVFLVLTPVGVAAQTQDTTLGEPILFGSDGIKKIRVSIAGMLDRFEQQKKTRVWKDTLKELEGKQHAQQVRVINDLFNKMSYVGEATQHYATPAEFIEAGGDCEEFALSKLLLLREIEIEGLLLFVKIRATGQDHAIAVVTLGETLLGLDNRREGLLTPKEIKKEYQILFAADKHLSFFVFGSKQ